MRPGRLHRLAGSNVFLTGAASGIGRATAEAVTAHGGEVVVTTLHTLRVQPEDHH